MQSDKARKCCCDRHEKSAAGIREIRPCFRQQKQYRTGECNVSRSSDGIMESEIRIEIFRHYLKRRPYGEAKRKEPYFLLFEKAEKYVKKIYTAGEYQKHAQKPCEIQQTDSAFSHLGKPAHEHHYTAEKKTHTTDKRRCFSTLALRESITVFFLHTNINTSAERRMKTGIDIL